MIEKKEWKEFQDTGLVWFINSILHVFGWSIVFDIDDETKEIKNVFPARVQFRGFGDESQTKGHIKIANYLKNNIDELVKEVNN